ncbi:MAG: acyl-CoA dehydratase activase-related protein [Fusobacteriota bacterium]
MEKIYRIGLDVGSTTVKVIILDNNKNIIFQKYARHFSEVRKTIVDIFDNIQDIFPDSKVAITIAGSGGLDIAKKLEVPFIQEVIASSNAIKEEIPSTNVAIELGGEDAKIVYFDNTIEQRMNGACAGGTGAFIDQMASLLKTDVNGLNELAKKGEHIYSIASRCGVFAKSDVQSLLNDGVSKEDLAMSILQAVVNQTISGLAQGREIEGNVAFLGGPLHFLSELRKRFIKTLELTTDQALIPKEGQYFVALGAALEEKEQTIYTVHELYEHLHALNSTDQSSHKGLDPLFNSEEEYESFKNRHSKQKVEKLDINKYQGNAYLGIDAGSTTTKIALVSSNGKLLYSFYEDNQGDPLNTTIESLKRLYKELPSDVIIANSAVTGYGEELIKAALKIDIGEVETVTHYKAAQYFLPEVDYILDIGGQDMKVIETKDGAIYSIMLNEACSSGCGSFISTFATSLGYEVGDFAKLGVKAENPVDLGSRCTVFMNSKVKQVQNEGATVQDISGGLATSVIKNALYKVIGYNNNSDLGNHIVVQGGTFHNDAVLRVLENLIGKEVVRPDITGIMGAFGAALLACEESEENQRSTMLSEENLYDFKVKSYKGQCQKCGNNCLLTIKKFADGRKFVSGNRCERGIGKEKEDKVVDNLYKYKYNRVFNYEPLDDKNAERGKIGIIRALNMYEDYPFWFTFFDTLGYQVHLSTESNQDVYQKGMKTIPSDSACYPAKLSHGHMFDLIEKGIKKIFHPSIPYNKKEDKEASNNYNCPIVTSYSETLRVNIEKITDENIKFYHPFLPIDNKRRLTKRLIEELDEENISKKEIKSAINKAYKELDNYKQDVRNKGEEVLEFLEKTNQKGIVLAGRPYHIDPEINHGIPELIESFDLPILSADSISHLGKIERPLQVYDQWVYHSRLYSAASFVAEHDNLELVQLNSFGCGLDAVTIDQVEEILVKKNKIFTCLKIDEISNLGAAKIRLRSLIAAMDKRSNHSLEETKEKFPKRKVFTKKMKSEHTILSPQMAPIHFQFYETAFKNAGYNLKILPAEDDNAVDIGLKYVNNDACYPSIIIVGQILSALESGEHDPNKTSVIISQTGGGCRATNYISFIRKALKEAGFEQVPVISLNTMGVEKNPGFKLTFPLIDDLIRSTVFGDLLMRVLYKVRPYEKVPGSANKLYDKWVLKCHDTLISRDKKEFKKDIYNIVKDFDNLPVKENLEKPKVGIVGEILVKFHPIANNKIVSFLEKEGAEVVVPDFLDFFLYSLYNHEEKYKTLSGGLFSMLISKLGIKGIEFLYRRPVAKALEKSKRFSKPESIYDIAESAKKHLSLSHQTGEGWFLTGEMVELIKNGVKNILCLQPFGCLPNHVLGKGMVKEIRSSYSDVNIKPLDFDPGASEVNQVNRIKLMLSVAFENLKKNELKKENENIESVEDIDSELIKIKS